MNTIQAPQQSVGKGRPWIESGLTLEQAKSKYVGKTFLVRFSDCDHVEMHVNSVQVHGGVSYAFCTQGRIVRKYKKGGPVRMTDVSLYTGRLEEVEEVKVGGTSCE